MQSLDDYIPLAGEKIIGTIYQKAYKLIHKHIVHINSTAHGGGVAEILNTLVLLMNDAGVETGWRVMIGPEDFFTVTTKFYNALQGHRINLTQNKKNLYLETNQRFSQFTHLDHDCIVIHDPPPLPLIKFNRKRQPWVWRSHIDLTEPNPQVWNFIKSIILRYDLMIVSSSSYIKKDIPIEQRVILPSIDPFSPKNMNISEETISKLLKKHSIPTDKPLLTQVSRFDPWKDPEGVLKVFERVKQKVDCRLVYCYNMLPDNPEGIIIYRRMEKKARKYIQRGDVLFVLGDNQLLINALQRISSVVIQKSIKEGFGLTVAEAMWKKTPVVASKVGGIPEQIINNRTGFLVDPYDIEGGAQKIITLLQDKKLAQEMGFQGREYIKKKFLITRHLLDYLNLFVELLR